MSILVDERTSLVVQGITGNEGTFHTLRNRDYGTKVVAGVTPGKAARTSRDPRLRHRGTRRGRDGREHLDDLRPTAVRGGAILEAVDAGVDLVVCITEGIPVRDLANVHSYLEASGTRLVGPNCPGVISPGAANVGIIPGEICARRGRARLPQRHARLSDRARAHAARIGQSTCVGMGGDPVHGIGFVEALELFQADAETELIVLTGEIGGDDEERAAAVIAERVTKPVVGYLAGFEAPPGKRMGHAGAIVTGSSGTAAAKAEALEAVGASVGRNPSQVADLVAERLG